MCVYVLVQRSGQVRQETLGALRVYSRKSGGRQEEREKRVRGSNLLIYL